MGMPTTKIAVTAVSFEKLFVRNATNTFRLQPKNQTNNENTEAWRKWYLDLKDWRHIAWKTLATKELGDALRGAILPLPAKYREVLFLGDVKNLDAEEAARVLGITDGAVKPWLSRARTLVRDALTFGLSSRISNKYSNLGKFYCGFPDSGSEPVAILR